MPADKRFHDRIKRIQSGKTWAPDGVIHTRGSRAADQRKRKSRGGLPLVVLVMAPIALAYAQPELLPDPVRGFIEAPDTETAMASLAQWDLLATISAQ